MLAPAEPGSGSPVEVLVDGAEIQGAVEALDRLGEEADIPAKVLVVHQFESGVVTNEQSIEPIENVQVVLSVDWFGSAEDKTTNYDVLVGDETIQYGGSKLFSVGPFK
jgi:hypothetical protein